MPQLIVKDGAPVSMLEAHLMSKLLFHDDELTQDACFVNEFLIQDGGLVKATTDENFGLPAWMVKSLVLGPSKPEIDQKMKPRFRAGVTAGHMLATMRLAASLGKRISLSRCVRVLERAQFANEHRVLGFEMYWGKEQALDAWRLMRPVAHLWAAHSLVNTAICNGEPIPPDKRPRIVFEISGAMYRWAATREVKHDGKTGPILDEATAWLPPEPYLNALAPWQMAPNEGLPKWLIQAIEHYKYAG